MNVARPFRRVPTALTALVLLASLGSAAHPPAVAAATSPFTDIVGTTFEADIDWLYAEGITVGCFETLFCPDGYVTRGEMASFLSRMFALPPTGTDFFTDDDGTTHETDIDRLAHAAITEGCAPTRFCPHDPVTRGEMASFLARAIPLTAGVGDNYFRDDDGTTHEATIDRAAAAGIASGCAYWRFCPAAWVTRGQMAGFLHRVVNPVEPPDPAPGPSDLFVATSGNDDGIDDGHACREAVDPCRTIRYALAIAFDGDTIHVGAGTFLEEDLTVGADLAISGDPAGTVIDGVGGRHRRILTIKDGRTVSLRYLTLTGGRDTFGGAIHSEASVLTITDSTIAGNAAYTGGGIYTIGLGSLLIANSTLSGNSAVVSAGAIYADGTAQPSVVAISNTTISRNTAPSGSGIHTESFYGIDPPSLQLRNSLVVGNTSTTGGDILGVVDAKLNSIVGIPAGLTLADILDPAGLADNGGPTMTIALTDSPSNPAIDKGHPATCAAAPVSGLDQRGLPRTPPCDIGSYELQP